MKGTLRISLFASVALAASLAAACASPDRGPGARPSAEFTRNEGPATLPIAGVVRDEQSRPIPDVGIYLDGSLRPGHKPDTWRTDGHGRFQIDYVSPGPVELRVNAGESAPTKVVETRAGVRDLVIVMDPGPQLILRLVDHVSGKKQKYARVTWKEPGGSHEMRRALIRDDGWTRFVWLPPDREIELWAHIDDDWRLVRARGLKPGDSERRIESEGFKDIAGKIRGSEALLETTLPGNFHGPLREHLYIDVYADSGYHVIKRKSVRDDGSFRVRGLPPGTYRVQLNIFADFISSVEQQVEAGTTDLVFDVADDVLPSHLRPGASK